MDLMPDRRGGPLRAMVAGAVLGIVLLHPAMEVLYWFGSHERDARQAGSLWRSAAGRVLEAFLPGMLPMTGAFAVIGSVVGWAVWRYARPSGPATGVGVARAASPGLAAILAAGEGERVEFKASARWDARLGRVNRALEDAVVHSVAGFLNHRGGTLLIGVSDGGAVVGLQPDCQSLRRRDRDGFEQFLMNVIQSMPGGHVCALMHVGFPVLEGVEVCQVVVDPSALPVYCQDGAVARYFMWTGNGTRELDARGAINHLAPRGGEAEWRSPGRASVRRRRSRDQPVRVAKDGGHV